VAVVLLFAAGIYVRGGTLDPTARDQTADLTTALRIHEGGFTWNGNRSPLLPLLLAPFARRDPAFFVAARLLSVLLAALCALALYAACARTWSPALGLWATVGFLFELRFQARRICPEPLVALLVILATWAFAAREESARPRRLALLAGVLLGLGWMAKGSALLALGALGLWALLASRRRRVEAVVLLALGFTLGGAPLLVFNARHFGTPLYNANSAHVMWEDAWDVDLDQTSRASLGSYAAHHDLGDAAARLLHGLGRQKAVEWVYAFLGVVLLAALLRLRRPDEPARQRAWRGIAVVSCFVWLPPMAWYEPIAASRRFLFPVLGLLPAAALGLCPWRPRLPSPLRRAVPWAAGAALAGAVALAAAHGNPWRELHVDEGTLALVRHLRAPGFRGARILARPSRDAPPGWLLEGQVTFVALPFAVAGEREAVAYVRSEAGYVLLGEGLLRLRPTPFGALAAWDPTRGVVLRDDLPAWLEPLWHEPGRPSRHVLLRVRGTR
jgi:hypothetical protein